MKDSKLLLRLSRLHHGSQEAVQNGTALNELDQYLHVERPIETKIKNKMRTIQAQGGGLLLLVGSAGDGKSHIISGLKSLDEFSDFEYRNDATEGCSPSMNAVETLKYTTQNFKDGLIDKTSDKLLIAINLGKLLDFIEEDEVKSNYTELVNVANSLLEDDQTQIIETSRIKVVSLSHQQSFELNINSHEDNEYPVDSFFMRSILERIAVKEDKNPFYVDFKEDYKKCTDEFNPVIANYQILQSPDVQNSIVKLIIEAIIRFNLIVTPREFLDFIYSILVYPRLQDYNERKDFFDALLPTLLFNGQGNKIQKALSQLDPAKCSSASHDHVLSLLYAAFDYDDNFLDTNLLGASITASLKKILKNFYANKNASKIPISTLIFRFKHLLSYHSENESYIAFLRCLVGYFKHDTDTYEFINNMVVTSIPRHYGSYYDKPNFVPLNVQGRQYKLFATLDLPPADFSPLFDAVEPNIFDPAICVSWKILDPDIPLKIDFVLFEHLMELERGKLATTYEGEKNLSFSNFVRRISKYSTAEKDVKIINAQNQTISLTNKYNKLQMQN